MLAEVTADLQGVLLGIAFYTIHIMVFLAYLWVLANKFSKLKFVNCVPFLSFGLSSAYFALDMARVRRGFVVQSNPAVAVYTSNDLHSRAIRPSIFFYVANIWVADAVLVWRCFAVWNRNFWVCAVPMAILACTVVAGVGDSYYWILPEGAKYWRPACLATSISGNLVTTSLIVVKLLSQKREVESTLGGRSDFAMYCRRILTVVIEGGLISTVFLILQLVFAASNNSSAFFVLLRALAQVMGIVPTLMMVYPAVKTQVNVHIHITTQESEQCATMRADSPAVAYTNPDTGRVGHREEANSAMHTFPGALPVTRYDVLPISSEVPLRSAKP